MDGQTVLCVRMQTAEPKLNPLPQPVTFFIRACTWQEQQSFMDVASETAADLTLELNLKRVMQANV